MARTPSEDLHPTPEDARSPEEARAPQRNRRRRRRSTCSSRPEPNSSTSAHGDSRRLDLIRQVRPATASPNSPGQPAADVAPSRALVAVSEAARPDHRTGRPLGAVESPGRPGHPGAFRASRRRRRRRWSPGTPSRGAHARAAAAGGRPGGFAPQTPTSSSPLWRRPGRSGGEPALRRDARTLLRRSRTEDPPPRRGSSPVPARSPSSDGPRVDRRARVRPHFIGVRLARELVIVPQDSRPPSPPSWRTGRRRTCAPPPKGR